MKIVVIASYAPSILNFRKALLLALLSYGDVYVLVPYENDETSIEIENTGAKYISIQMNSQGLSVFSDIKLLVHLKRIITEIKPTFVLSYTAKPVVWGSIAASISGVPGVYSLITGLGFAFTEVSTLKQRLVHFILKKLYQNALKRNKVVFFQNIDDLNYFKKLKIITNDNTEIVNGSGIDLVQFSFDKKASSSPIRFLLVARLIKDKGVFEYLEAARNLKKRYNNIEFHLVGYLDNNPRRLSKNELDDIIRDKIVIFHGRLQDVREMIKHCSVYVLPSYREGTPRSVLEAMSIGRAIITTDAPGCRETVIQGRNGFLVPIKDPALLAKTMEEFIINPSLISKMGIESRKIAEEKYDVHKVNQMMLEAMEIPH